MPETRTWLPGSVEQDIVIANNFLCHMEAADAERCLRNIARLVKLQAVTCLFLELIWTCVPGLRESLGLATRRRTYLKRFMMAIRAFDSIGLLIMLA